MKKYLIIAACLAVVCAIPLAKFAIAAPARAAARNLAAINSISAGRTTEAELLSRKEFQTMSRACIQETCMYYTVAENTLLGVLHLAPRTSIRTSVAVRNGMVDNVSVFTMRDGLHPVRITQQETLPKSCTANPCLKLPPALLPANVLAGAVILVDNQSEVRNRMPQAVNAQCLSQRSGCSQYGDFIPLVRELHFAETLAALESRK